MTTSPTPLYTRPATCVAISLIHAFQAAALKSYLSVARGTLKVALEDQGPKGLERSRKWTTMNTGLIFRGPSKLDAVDKFRIRDLVAVVFGVPDGKTREVPVSV
jgi:hypothetical protein